MEEGVGKQSGAGEERELGGGSVDGAAGADVPQARARSGRGRGGGRRRGAGGEPGLGERRVQLRELVGGCGLGGRAWRRRPGARRKHFAARSALQHTWAAVWWRWRDWTSSYSR